MAAPEGNSNAMKFRTPEERQKVAKDYDTHCSNGLSDESFYIDEETLERYIKDFPIDFGTVKESRRKRCLYWENIGIDGMNGRIYKFNATVWIFNMKNRFGWKDNTEVKKDTNKPKNIADLIRNFGERSS